MASPFFGDDPSNLTGNTRYLRAEVRIVVPARYRHVHVLETKMGWSRFSHHLSPGRR